MTVATVKSLFESIGTRLRESGADVEREQLARIAGQLQPYAGMAWDVFLAQLAKVKKPAKTQEEKEAEKRAKSELALKAKAEKKAADDAKKADEKQRKADEKAEQKKQAESRKTEEKHRKATEAAKAKEDAKAAKAQAKLDEANIKSIEEAQTARKLADTLQHFVDKLPGGGIPVEELEAVLLPLKAFNKVQLLIVAKTLDSDGGLTEKSTKAAITKQLESNIRRLWKTSHNVLH